MDDDTIRRTRRRLLKWGHENFRVYPWRLEKDPWLSLVAEVLLQRTRASQVQRVYVELKARFPTAEMLAQCSGANVRFLTERLGLHRRGEMLLTLARAVASRGGTPPMRIEELCRFRGIGMYTAAAWLSLHQGKRGIVIDANICRWLSRMTGLPYNRDPRHVRWIQALADDLTPRTDFRNYNYAVLDFTMEVCKAKTPKCGGCPLRDDCNHSRLAD